MKGGADLSIIYNLIPLSVLHTNIQFIKKATHWSPDISVGGWSRVLQAFSETPHATGMHLKRSDECCSIWLSSEPGLTVTTHI